MNKVMFIDLEVENHEYYGHGAGSPRHPDNYIVLSGWAVDEKPYDGPIEYIYNANKEEARSRPWLKIPDDVWLLVAHNAPYELDHMLFSQRPEILRFLKRGGRVFCTAVGRYLVTNQQETYPRLDDIAPLYGGTHKVDGISIQWKMGKRTSEIDPDLLTKYLIDPDEGDVANTRKVFYGICAELIAQGKWTMALERCEAMVFNALAMDSGLHIDKELALKQRDAGELRLDELRKEFAAWRAHAAPPPELEFKESSDFHMSAWLYGGPVKYRHKVPAFKDDGTPKWVKADFVTFLKGDRAIPVQLNEDGTCTVNVNGKLLTEQPAVVAFEADCEVERYKSGKNKGSIKVVRGDTGIQATVWADTHFTFPPQIDLQLLPDATRKEFLKEFTGKRQLLDNSMVVSTGADALQKLQAQPVFSEVTQKLLTDLLTFAKLDKDLGTYYLREVLDDEGNVAKKSGMLQYLTPQGIIYHTLNMTSTETTRLSATRPNMQNVPRGDTSEVKQVFTSRYDNPAWLSFAVEHGIITQEVFDECYLNIAQGIPNGAVVEADYSALEVVTLAAFSQDKNLIDALLKGTDMHCLRLSKKLGEPYESVFEKCHSADHPQHKEYKTMRTHIKPPSFAYQYGATARGIAYATGVTVEYAEEFIRNERALFPGVESFFEDLVYPQVQNNTTTHREQRPDGTWALYKRGTYTAPSGTAYSFREYEGVKWVDGVRYETMDFKPTQMRNYPIQGESSFFVQGMSGQVMRWLVANDFFGGRVQIINTVHDAIYVDMCLSIKDTVCAGLKQIMESLPTYFSAKYGYTLNVPFPVEVEYGPSMYEKTKWKAPS